MRRYCLWGFLDKPFPSGWPVSRVKMKQCWIERAGVRMNRKEVFHRAMSKLDKAKVH